MKYILHDRYDDEMRNLLPTSRPRLLHFSFHKCMTGYYASVMGGLFGSLWNPLLCYGYKHYNSYKNKFLNGYNAYFASSLNNHFVDVNQLEECRVTRFERDPRDLVVSGYYYHKDASEHWTEIVAPTDEDFQCVNGLAPAVLRKEDVSFAAYLNEVDKEKGLIAEAKFREYHFDTMRKWSESEGTSFRYREIIGNEVEVFEQMFDEYEVTSREKRKGLELAEKYSLGGEREISEHIRNPNPSQWREHFTPAVEAQFKKMYPDLIADTGYDRQGTLCE